MTTHHVRVARGKDVRVGMVDDVHVDRHPFALDVQAGNEDWRHGDRRVGVHGVPNDAQPRLDRLEIDDVMRVPRSRPW